MSLMVHYFYMETNKPTSSKILSWTLSLAIVIVVNLFFYYIIATIYPSPKFETFCSEQPVMHADPVSCVDAGGQWTNTQMAPTEITAAVKNGQALGYCDANFTCNKHFQDTESIYNRNVFIILIVLSLVVLTLGVFLPIEILSLGFSWAGVISLIIASGRYWSDADNWMRVIILAVALALLVWLAMKKSK